MDKRRAHDNFFHMTYRLVQKPACQFSFKNLILSYKRFNVQKIARVNDLPSSLENFRLTPDLYAVAFSLGGKFFRYFAVSLWLPAELCGQARLQLHF